MFFQKLEQDKYDYANTCHYIEEFKRIKVTKPQGESW
jgi:hypothetical protein